MRRTVFLFLIGLCPVVAFGQNLPDTYPPRIDRGTYYLEFTAVDSTEHPDSPRLPDSIDASDFPFLKSPGKDKEVGGVWRIVRSDDNPDLTGDDTVYVDPKAHSSTPYVSFSLAEYYPEHELILFESRQNEYSRYVIVARRSGEVAVAFGPPVFSPNGEWFVAMGSDSVSGWSPQGLQLFAVGEGWFNEVIRFRTGSIKFKTGRRARNREMGGPVRCQWIDEDTFRLEMIEKRLGPGRSDAYEHYRVDIRKSEERGAPHNTAATGDEGPVPPSIKVTRAGSSLRTRSDQAKERRLRHLMFFAVDTEVKPCRDPSPLSSPRYAAVW